MEGKVPGESGHYAAYAMRVIVQPDAGIVPIVRAVHKAKRTIDVCIFRFDRDEIEKALASAVQRGVKVRAFIASTNRGGESRLRKLEQRLLEAGVMVTRSNDDLLRYHAKYMVADDTLYLFGFNFTRIDIDKSRTFAIATRNRRSVQEALKLFEADATRQPYTPARSNLVVSPDTARERLAAFIKGARRQLAVYDGQVQDPRMLKLLKERADKGVDIRIIGKVKGSGGALQVRPLKSMRLHVRTMIRDGTRAFVGSQSLRKPELDNRREVGLIITSPSAARQLLQVFEADWEESAGKAGDGGKPGKDEKAEKNEKAEKLDKGDKKRKTAA